MSTPLDIDPVARWLLRDCALREARHAHQYLRDDRMALALVDAARALGPMDEKQEADARQVERWAGRLNLQQPRCDMDPILFPDRKRPADAGTEGLALFESPRQAPAQPVATSEGAAARVSPTLSQKRRDVLLHICRHRPEGATDNELIADLTAKGWNPNTPRARRVELYRGAWLDEDGTRDGSTVWRPSAKAWDWFHQFDRAAEGYIGREDAA